MAQFKFTVLLMPTGSHKITGLSIDPQHYESEHKIEDEEIKVNYLVLISNYCSLLHNYFMLIFDFFKTICDFF